MYYYFNFTANVPTILAQFLAEKDALCLVIFMIQGLLGREW